MGVDGFRVDTAVHIPRATWNRRFLPAIQERVTSQFGAEAAKNFFVFGEVAAFVNDKWNRGSVNHSAQFYTWKERKEYDADDAKAALEMYDYEQQLGTGNQPTSTNAFLNGNAYHTPDDSRCSPASSNEIANPLASAIAPPTLVPCTAVTLPRAAARIARTPCLRRAT